MSPESPRNYRELMLLLDQYVNTGGSEDPDRAKHLGPVNNFRTAIQRLGRQNGWWTDRDASDDEAARLELQRWPNR